MENPTINKRIIKIWYKYSKLDSTAIAPLFFGKTKQNPLVFVGLNPSFSLQGFKKVLAGTEYENIKPKAYYKWAGGTASIARIGDYINIDRYAKEKYPYFKRPKEIAKKLNAANDWDHLDLFMLRETSQAKAMIDICSKGKSPTADKGPTLTPFGLEQFAVFKSILVQKNAKCIVIINAFASKVVQQYMKDIISWDESKGHHHIELQDTKIPIFFTSMLSGQRALDNGSFERLVWQLQNS